MENKMILHTEKVFVYVAFTNKVIDLIDLSLNFTRGYLQTFSM